MCGTQEYGTPPSCGIQGLYTTHNPRLAKLSYLELVAAQVMACRDEGLLVMLDLHVDE